MNKVDFVEALKRKDFKQAYVFVSSLESSTDVDLLVMLYKFYIIKDNPYKNKEKAKQFLNILIKYKNEYAFIEKAKNLISGNLYQKDIIAAIDLLTSIVDQNDDAIFMLSQIYSSKIDTKNLDGLYEDYDEAIALCDQLIKRNSKYKYKAIVLKANLILDLGKLDKDNIEQFFVELLSIKDVPQLKQVYYRIYQKFLVLEMKRINEENNVITDGFYDKINQEKIANAIDVLEQSLGK